MILGKFFSPVSNQRISNRSRERGFVNMSAVIWSVGQYTNSMIPSCKAHAHSET